MKRKTRTIELDNGKKRAVKLFSKSQPLKVVVNRKSWDRGNSSGLLLSADTEKRCGLGFLACQIGLSDQDILDIGTPEAVSSKFPTLVNNGGLNTEVCDKLMDINDDNKLDDKIREIKLKKTGLKAGIRFVFR